jgi:hypothetical protein
MQACGESERCEHVETEGRRTMGGLALTAVRQSHQRPGILDTRTFKDERQSRFSINNSDTALKLGLV